MVATGVAWCCFSSKAASFSGRLCPPGSKDDFQKSMLGGPKNSHR